MQALRPARRHEDRDASFGPLLVLRVWRISRHGALPPGLALLTIDLAYRGVEGLGTVLDHHRVRIGAQVVDPHRVLRRTAHRPDQRVLAVVLDPHQCQLAQLPALGADRGDDHDRHAGVEQRVGVAAARLLVRLDLVTDPLRGARFVFSTQGHGPTLRSETGFAHGDAEPPGWEPEPEG